MSRAVLNPKARDTVIQINTTLQMLVEKGLAIFLKMWYNMFNYYIIRKESIFMETIIKITTEYITLGQFLKFSKNEFFDIL